MAPQADDAVGAHDALPLQGVVLCCTSLPQDVRTRVADVATQMGAVHKLDLTSDVTHLVAGSAATPKYRYVAKDRPDIRVLHQSWVDAVREAWLEGGDVDVAALETRHRLPTFHHLKICLTGVDNLDQRAHISAAVEREGAEYHGDLTTKVTHLIAAAPHGAKYTHAKKWGIAVVSLHWFRDSLERGMALDESCYDPTLPDAEQGRGAFTAVRPPAAPRTSLGKRPRHAETPPAAEDAGKRKLRRTASTRLNSQSQDMWHDISARDRTRGPTDGDQWKDDSDSREPTAPPERPPIHARQSVVVQPAPEAENVPAGLFAGSYILIRGFPRDKANRLQQFLEPNGACVVHSERDLERASEHAFFRSRYLLVPHALAHGPIELPDVPAGTPHVTEWWVERCIHYKRFFDPAEDTLSRPLWDVKIAGLAGVTVATTGFSGVDFRQTAETLKLMGAAYEEKLAPSVSILISGSETVKKEKAYYASKHGIPVVAADWLWECLRLTRRVPYDAFQIKLPALNRQELAREPSSRSVSPKDALQRQAGGADKPRGDAVPQRLSNMRKKHAVPSLPLSAGNPTARAASRAAPFIHEDDDNDDSDDGDNDENDGEPAPTMPTASLGCSPPLQELSPNLSPRKASQLEKPVLHADEDAKAAATRDQSTSAATTAPQSPNNRQRSVSPHEEDRQPPPRPYEELTASLATLLQQKISSRPDPGKSDVPPKRKNRPLGRSLSGMGSRSASMSMPPEATTGSPGFDPDSLSAADGFSAPRADEPQPPSTQLGYETADAEQHRQMMEDKLKVRLQDENTVNTVASVGTVKDSGGDADAGVGSRVRGRHRMKVGGYSERGA